MNLFMRDIDFILKNNAKNTSKRCVFLWFKTDL